MINLTNVSKIQLSMRAVREKGGDCTIISELWLKQSTSKKKKKLRNGDFPGSPWVKTLPMQGVRVRCPDGEPSSHVMGGAARKNKVAPFCKMGPQGFDRPKSLPSLICHVFVLVNVH